MMADLETARLLQGYYHIITPFSVILVVGNTFTTHHEIHETCHSVTFYFMKKAPNDAVTPQRLSQFTPKMKANAVPRLLSSLV